MADRKVYSIESFRRAAPRHSVVANKLQVSGIGARHRFGIDAPVEGGQTAGTLHRQCEQVEVGDLLWPVNRLPVNCVESRSEHESGQNSWWIVRVASCNLWATADGRRLPGQPGWDMIRMQPFWVIGQVAQPSGVVPQPSPRASVLHMAGVKRRNQYIYIEQRASSPRRPRAVGRSTRS